MATLKITQVRSTNERSQRQRRTMKALGLRRIRHSVQHNDTPQIRGMIRTVQHLVEVEEIESDAAGESAGEAETPQEAPASSEEETPEEETPEEAPEQAADAA